MTAARKRIAGRPEAPDAAPSATYLLDDQIGFILRQASQRHTALFGAHFGDITPTQWAALSKLYEVGPTSQNLLGRMTAMDVATIKGVVDRLVKRGLARSRADGADARRRLVELSGEGRAFVVATIPTALQITDETLAPLNERERAAFALLLRKLR
jgi:DNA-binding MarR family transcriptional regulator